MYQSIRAVLSFKNAGLAINQSALLKRISQGLINKKCLPLIRQTFYYILTNVEE
jgi:hypothetical protein